MIADSEITIENIDRLITLFNNEYGVYDDVLNRLYKNADNADYDNVFCRVGLLDLIYNTGIQRFNKGGIDVVTRHINNIHAEIDDLKKAKSIDYKAFDKLRMVEYKDANYVLGEERRIPSFASKFLSFTRPDLYPIMDSVVKKAIGASENAEYESFCDCLANFRSEKIEPLQKHYSLKDIDKFLWMCGKIQK